MIIRVRLRGRVRVRLRVEVEVRVMFRIRAWANAMHLVAALPEAPLDLHRRDGRDGVRAPDLVGGALAEAHVLHLALLHQLLRTWT